MVWLPLSGMFSSFVYGQIRRALLFLWVPRAGCFLDGALRVYHIPFFHGDGMALFSLQGRIHYGMPPGELLFFLQLPDTAVL